MQLLSLKLLCADTEVAAGTRSQKLSLFKLLQENGSYC
jgi:hypothetical protein